MELYLFSVVVLFGMAISAIVVGVSNDAVNFLNSAVGSHVAPRWGIMGVASIGILLGVTFSSGMMEVARKGIFHPAQFNMPELLIIFLAVMFTNIILLDFFNTFALPTSTTVAVVFGLLGASTAVSFIKVYNAGQSISIIVNYINSARALAIISGILISIIVAFTAGVIIQFVSRLVFTFDYSKRLKRYGAIWGSFALTAIIYFIFIKGARGASFLTQETINWILSHTFFILFVNILFWAIIFQFLLTFTRMHILKVIVLIGTGALAMAFAANDLVNFIGVPLAGYHAFCLARASNSDPLQVDMKIMAGNVQSETWMLLVAGAIMVTTLWVSRKARGVTQTEVNLGRQDEEGEERFGSSTLARLIVFMMITFAENIRRVLPESVFLFISRRFERLSKSYSKANPHFDLLRASDNLMVASALISFATSLKLPLSTTYVTFMVAMGTSLADRAWGRESAVYRITGVITVVGGWFFTAFMAAAVSLICAALIYYLRIYSIVSLIGICIFFLVKTHYIHKKREDATEISEAALIISDSSDKLMSQLIHNLSDILAKAGRILKRTYRGTCAQNRKMLKSTRGEALELHQSSQRLMRRFIMLVKFTRDEADIDLRLVSALQELGRHLVEITEICYRNVANHHRGLLEVQQQELLALVDQLSNLFEKVQSALVATDDKEYDEVSKFSASLIDNICDLNKQQIKRIRRENIKTKQSVLFFSVLTHTDEVIQYIIEIVKGCRTRMPKS